MELSIVIPAYNEEKRLGGTLSTITEYAKKNFNDYEIIVVDDCSKDSTSLLASNFEKVRVLRNEKNMGKGYSVKRGLLNAKFKYALFTDSDLATPIEEIEKFYEHMDKGYSIIIGSRNIEGSRVEIKQTKLRNMMGKVYPLLVKLLVINDFGETQCGFKLFITEDAKKIVEYQTLNRFSFDVELLFIAKKHGYKTKEVPVIWRDQKGSKLNPYTDSFDMLWELLKIKINSLLGKYKKRN
ncbi:dolichyl-phosphate beta-glucosyltransferase [Nanoarchaeota archaeon]